MPSPQSQGSGAKNSAAPSDQVPATVPATNSALPKHKTVAGPVWPRGFITTLSVNDRDPAMQLINSNLNLEKVLASFIQVRVKSGDAFATQVLALHADILKRQVSVDQKDTIKVVKENMNDKIKSHPFLFAVVELLKGKETSELAKAGIQAWSQLGTWNPFSQLTKVANFSKELLKLV